MEQLLEEDNHSLYREKAVALTPKLHLYTELPQHEGPQLQPELHSGHAIQERTYSSAPTLVSLPRLLTRHTRFETSPSIDSANKFEIHRSRGSQAADDPP